MTNKNPGPWKVAHQYAGGDMYIRVYRMRDINATDHSGNREYINQIFETDEEAQAMADELNRQQAEHAKEA